jgi:hypothetical protein
MESLVIHSSEPPLMPAQLLAVVLSYQCTYQDWLAEDDPERSVLLRKRLGMCHDQLWVLLAQPLMDVARGWVNSGAGQDMHANPASYPSRQDAVISLAQNLYLHVIEALPGLRVDPNKNLLGCLLTIAQRGMSNENRKIYADDPRRHTRSASDQHPASGSSAAAMWPQERKQERVSGGEDPEELADPNSHDQEDRLIREIDTHACLQQVWAFWQEVLTPDDQQIMKIRWGEDPPVAFERIADQLGPGWTAAAVRQRHHRILKRTRQYLRDEGMLGDDDQEGFETIERAA